MDIQSDDYKYKVVESLLATIRNFETDVGNGKEKVFESVSIDMVEGIASLKISNSFRRSLDK